MGRSQPRAHYGRERAAAGLPRHAVPGTKRRPPTGAALLQEVAHRQHVARLQAEFAAMLRDTLDALQRRLEERHTARAAAAVPPPPGLLAPGALEER